MKKNHSYLFLSLIMLCVTANTYSAQSLLLLRGVGARVGSTHLAQRAQMHSVVPKINTLGQHIKSRSLGNSQYRLIGVRRMASEGGNKNGAKESFGDRIKNINDNINDLHKRCKHMNMQLRFINVATNFLIAVSFWTILNPFDGLLWGYYDLHKQHAEVYDLHKQHAEVVDAAELLTLKFSNQQVATKCAHIDVLLSDKEKTNNDKKYELLQKLAREVVDITGDRLQRAESILISHKNLGLEQKKKLCGDMLFQAQVTQEAIAKILAKDKIYANNNELLSCAKAADGIVAQCNALCANHSK